jgi:predicted RNase H-like HicB family nuclease
MEVIMLYPVYVHKEKNSAYGMTFPDFEGCFSAADTVNDISRMAQEAVELHFEGESIAIPPPSTPEQWQQDERFSGGFWMMVDIDLGKIKNRPVRLNISLPEYLVRQIDEFAASHHMTRSGFIAKATQEAIRHNT